MPAGQALHVNAWTGSRLYRQGTDRIALVLYRQGMDRIAPYVTECHGLSPNVTDGHEMSQTGLFLLGSGY